MSAEIIPITAHTKFRPAELEGAVAQYELKPCDDGTPCSLQLRKLADGGSIPDPALKEAYVREARDAYAELPPAERNQIYERGRNAVDYRIDHGRRMLHGRAVVGRRDHGDRRFQPSGVFRVAVAQNGQGGQPYPLSQPRPRVAG